MRETLSPDLPRRTVAGQASELVSRFGYRLTIFHLVLGVGTSRGDGSHRYLVRCGINVAYRKA